MDDAAAGPPPLFLTDADVQRAFDWRAAIMALADAYGAPAGEGFFPPRSMARGPGFWLRVLSGIAPGTGLMGAKLIAASPKNRRASYLLPLFDHESVALVGLLDANSITGFRTAATSALAADRLVPPGPLQVAMLGSGFEAQKHLRALAAVRPISSVAVYSPSPESRARFVDAVADLGLSVAACASARDAIAGAGLVVCAARSRDETPLFDGNWLRPGATVVSIGSTLPEQREIDPVAIGRAALIVADMPSEVAHDTGDMIAARAAGVDVESRLVPLAALVAGTCPGRRSDDDIVIYKSVGAALQDLTVAAMCLARARAQGLGTPLPVTIAPVAK
jgi:ornithine cyclodeaminase/alanine dehydrogenase